MEPTSRPAITVGYWEDQKGYRLWREEDQKVFTASNVEFFESEQNVLSSSNPIYLPLDSWEPMDTDKEIEAPSNRNSPEKEEVNVEEKLSEEEKRSVNRKRKSDTEEEAATKSKVAKTATKSTNQQPNLDPSGPMTRSASKLARLEDGEDSDEEFQSTPGCRS